MIKLLDLKSEVRVTVAGTVFQFRPLMYAERMTLTIASISTFQTEFADVSGVTVKNDKGEDVLVNPYRTLMRNELFGKAIDKIMISTFVEFVDSPDLTKRFGNSFETLLESMQERVERESLRDAFLSNQGVDFETLLKTAGNSASLSETSPQNQDPDKGENSENGDDSIMME